MSEILSIEQLRQMACPVIDIPNFDNTGTIKVRVQKPRLMAMAAQGKIPNYLMSIAMEIAGLPSKDKPKELSNEEKMKQIGETMELYCRACLVEPTYDEFKDIMTDEQMEAIFEWAIGDVKKMSTFRTNEENGASNSHGQGVSKEAK